jgi:hypothetical protein
MAKKNPAAVALGKLGGKASMKAKSAKEREKFARAGGLSGGKARAAVLTPAKRKEIAQRAAAARWGNKVK